MITLTHYFLQLNCVKHKVCGQSFIQRITFVHIFSMDTQLHAMGNIIVFISIIRNTSVFSLR